MSDEEPRWRRYIRFWKQDPAADADDEILFHIEERASLNVSRGMTPEAARVEAEQRFGDAARIRRKLVADARREVQRARRVEGWSGVVQDIRFALRGLRRSPFYAFAAIVTLGLGIGANTATFSVVDAVLLRPLPYENAQRLVSVQNAWQDEASTRISPAEYLNYRKLRSFSAFGVYATGSANLIDAGNPERLVAAYVSPGALAAVGAHPIVGRIFQEGEGLAGHDAYAVISEGLWHRRFGGARSVIGSAINVDGAPTTIVGVLPASFALPRALKDGERVDLYQPFEADPATTTARGSHFLLGVGRLRDGVSATAANAEIGALAAHFAQTYPTDYPPAMNFRAYVTPLRDMIVGDIRPLLLVLLAGVCFVLLIACANVSSLVLTRTEDRRRELAVRVALGAGRWRVSRQLLMENLVVALLGGGAGLGIAFLGTRALASLQPGDIPRIADVSVDARVLLFTITVSIVAAVLFGAGPTLLRARDGGLLGDGGVLRDGMRTTATRRTQSVRSALIALEVALSIVLLAGAGLMLRSFAHLMAVDPGYSTENVLTVPIALPPATYATSAQSRLFFSRLVTDATAQPGVVHAGAVGNLPLDHGTGDLNIHIEGREKRDTEVSDKLDWTVVTPGYFEAIGIPLLRGRDIATSDDEHAPGAVVINEAAARLHWPGEDALGKRFTLGGHAGPGMVTVVGIVRDIRQDALADAPAPTMYLAHQQFTFWNGGSAAVELTLVLRTRGDPSQLSSSIRDVVRRLDSSVPVGAFASMHDVMRRSVATPRFTMFVLAIFAIVALVLALIGIYGLISYTVARRTRELAMRMALGARAFGVLRMVILQAITPVAAGLAIGIGAAAMLTRTLRSMLFDVRPGDPLTFGAVTCVLAVTAILAAGIPALRASRIAPMQALREE